MINFGWRTQGATLAVTSLTVLSLLSTIPFGVSSFAGGGTAKPPAGAVAPFVTPTLPTPVITANVAQIHGFDDTGFIQAATLDTTNANCPNTASTQPDRFGGTLTLNSGPIVIPCNLVIQMPANTLTWAQFIKGGPSLALGTGYPSFEMHAVGNIVGSQRIAALLYASQQSLNTSTGVITGIDYSTGNLLVDTGAASSAIVQINDPNGRFGRKQSPDPRFSVDDANPTVHAGTGYPMCVPRTDPATADDALCPQANRPKPATTGQCRNFSVAGIVPPKSGELTPAPPGQVYCSEFVMNSVAGRSATDPDPRQQAPFEVGDAITFSGTLIPANTVTASPAYISAHTVEANLGIFTMPGTQPNYLANGLSAGQYFAPTFAFIFPENVKPGDLLVPFDFWHLAFLRYGEGATTQSAIGPAVGPLEPTPWGGPSATIPGAPTIGTATAGDKAATVTWTPPASDGGAPITGYTVNALNAGLLVGTVTVAGNVTTATVTGLTNGTAVTIQVLATNAVGTGPASAASNAVTPTAPAPAASAVSLSPASVIGGTASVGTVTLTSAAPIGDAVVTLASSAAAATVPASVTVPAGSTSGTFSISTTSVTASTPATITATYGGATASATLTVTSATPSTSLSTVSVNPTTVTGGTASQGTVLLTTAAPAGGWAVALSSSSTAVSVPANVTVPAGALIATFPVTTSAVTTSTSATITASDGAVTRTTALTVTPIATAALTVTATGRAGETVSPTPAGISVTVGSTGTASFPGNTSITLRATNNRGVVWSGACSSGGAKTLTCTFTITANASVTANVQ